MKTTFKNSSIKTAFLGTGITIAQQALTSLNVDRHGVEMNASSIGIHVHHLKSGAEYLVPWSNVHIAEFMKDKQIANE